MSIILLRQFADRDTVYPFHSSLTFSVMCIVLGFLLESDGMKSLKEKIN